MLGTVDFLKMLKESNGDCSDYRVAKLLGVTTAAVCKWTKKESGMSSKTGLKVAKLLSIDKEFVLLCLIAERQKDSASKEVLEHICERLKPENLAA